MNEHEAYASLLADLARELLALYADDHDSIMFEYGYDDDEMKAFDSEVDRISKRIDYLESMLMKTERTCKQEERGWGTEGDHARVWLTCGHDCMVPTVQDLPRYCPNCGTRITEEDTNG